LRRARYPLRGSKYANHLYTDHQHVVLLALRQHFRKSYRDFCEMIEVCTEILDELGLRRLERLLLRFLEEARVRTLYLAVDSTGFSSTSASTYYTRVLEARKSRLGGHRRGVLTRRYLKQTVAVEPRKQLIVAMKFRRGPSNDSPDFIWTLKKVLPAELPVKLVVADKGYDAESNHEYAQDVLGARTAIPVRAASRPKIKMRGKRRKKQAKSFDKRGYDGHRPKVETVFSVEKRKMGSTVLARNANQQHKELIFRAFSYNSVRMEALFLLFIEDFYKAPAVCHDKPSLLSIVKRRKIGRHLALNHSWLDVSNLLEAPSPGLAIQVETALCPLPRISRRLFQSQEDSLDSDVWQRSEEGFREAAERLFGVLPSEGGLAGMETPAVEYPKAVFDDYPVVGILASQHPRSAKLEKSQ
jgi:hypothetical protein